MTSEKSEVTALGNLSATRASENSNGYGYLESAARFVKKIKTVGAVRSATYKVVNMMQPGEYSTGGGMDGAPAQGSVAKVNGNRNVPYLNRNDAKRNLNLNWWDNDWNGNYRFLAVRHCYNFSRPAWAGVFCTTCRRQPPSIRPIPPSWSER